jgi:hypothetical protein
MSQQYPGPGQQPQGYPPQYPQQQPPQGYYQYPPPQYQPPHQYPPPPPKKPMGIVGAMAIIIGGTLAGCVLIAGLLAAMRPAQVTPTAEPFAAQPTQAVAGVATRGPDFSATRIAEMDLTARAGVSQPLQQQPASTPTLASNSGGSGTTSTSNGFTFVEGPGKELIGQTVENDGLIVTVTAVDRLSRIQDSRGKVATPQGVFLVVQYDMKNNSNRPRSIIFLRLLDNKNREFSPNSNSDASFMIAFSNRYKSDLNIQPTFSGKDYTTFDVPADASGFTLKKS